MKIFPPFQKFVSPFMVTFGYQQIINHIQNILQIIYFVSHKAEGFNLLIFVDSDNLILRVFDG